VLYLITVNYHSGELIAELLASIQEATEVAYQRVIVNNSPGDPALDPLRSQELTILEAGKNLGFGGGCNLGLTWVYQQDPTAIAWLLNPDTTLTPGAIAQAIQCFTHHPDRSILGTRIVQPDGRLWFGGGRFLPAIGRIAVEDFFAHQPTAEMVACDWITGCSLLLNLSQFSACPQFDPAYFLYYEDFDLCRRYAAAGHSIAITRRITVIHRPSSITDRTPGLKLQSSTYSYLLTLERYTSRSVLILRLIRILLYSLVLLLGKPAISLGKLRGVIQYLSDRSSGNLRRSP